VETSPLAGVTLPFPPPQNLFPPHLSLRFHSTSTLHFVATLEEVQFPSYTRLLLTTNLAGILQDSYFWFSRAGLIMFMHGILIRAS